MKDEQHKTDWNWKQNRTKKLRHYLMNHNLQRKIFEQLQNLHLLRTLYIRSWFYPHVNWMRSSVSITVRYEIWIEWCSNSKNRREFKMRNWNSNPRTESFMFPSWKIMKRIMWNNKWNCIRSIFNIFSVNLKPNSIT